MYSGTRRLKRAYRAHVAGGGRKGLKAFVETKHWRQLRNGAGLLDGQLYADAEQWATRKRITFTFLPF